MRRAVSYLSSAVPVRCLTSLVRYQCGVYLSVRVAVFSLSVRVAVFYLFLCAVALYPSPGRLDTALTASVGSALLMLHTLFMFY